MNGILFKFAVCLAAIISLGHEDTATAAPYPTVASVNNDMGRGVLVSNSPTGRVFFLTARHVATYHGLFRHDIDLDFKCLNGQSVHRLIKSGEKRWLTTARPDYDLAWIELTEEELPQRKDIACADVNSFTEHSLSGAEGQKVLIAAYQDRPADFTHFIFARDIKFRGNSTLLCATQEVGLLNVKIKESESGSPVFARSKNGEFATLIGIVTVGADESAEGGFLPVVTVAEKIKNNFRDYDCTWLYGCERLF